MQSGPNDVKGFVAGRGTTATKTNTPVLETPQSISVITPDQIVAQDALNVSQAIRYTAGVTGSVIATDTRFDAPNIRGFLAPIYLDGQLLPIGASTFARSRVEVFGLQEIDILKGAAASALYGQTPPGGLVNLVSLHPSETLTRTVFAEGNSYGNVRSGFDVSGPADPAGHFLYRLTVVGHDGGTQIQHVKDQNIYVAPAVTYRPDGATSVTILGSYQHDHTGTPEQFLPASGTLFTNPNGRIPINANTGEPNHDFYDRDQTTIGYEFEHNINSQWKFRQKLRYAAIDTDTEVVFGNGFAANQTTLNRLNLSVPESATALTLDNNLIGKVSTGPLAHTLLFGVDYRYATSDLHEGFGIAPSINPFNPVYGAAITTPTITIRTGQRQNQAGIYAQDQIRLGGFGLTLSGRHDDVDTRTINYIANTNKPQSDDAFSGRAALNYVFDSGVAPYVAFSRSFLPSLGTAFGGAALAPTFGSEYEAGIKYQPTGTNILLTAAAFDEREQNYLTPDPNHIGFNIQTGQVHIRGLEFEAKASLTERLNVVAAYTVTDAHVVGGNPTTAGKRLNPIPYDQVALFADYTLHTGALSGFGFGGGVRYVGVSFGDLANTLVIPSYTLFDATLHYDLEKLNPEWKGARLAVNAQNIANKNYVASCQSLTTCYYGNGRLIQASLRYSW